MRLLRRLVVDGDSMAPGLVDGDRVLSVAWGAAQVGDLVARRDPRLPERVLVKRLRRVTPEGWWVEGDNPPASTDSRHFGPVTHTELTGWVWLRYWPEQRRGRVR